MVTQDGTGEEDFAALLAESFGQDNVKEGEILRGTVIAVGKDYAIVDVGYKSEGQVPLEEFRQADGSIGVAPGDVVDVLLESLSLIHISEPTRLLSISYAVFCLK